MRILLHGNMRLPTRLSAQARAGFVIVLIFAGCHATRPLGHPIASQIPVIPLADYGGQEVTWPVFHRSTPAPPALGAVVTTSAWQLADGKTLPSGLTLPRVGGTDAAPAVMTPCGRITTFARGTFSTIAPAGAKRTVVLIDPGHGGQDSGAIAADGTREATRVLQLAMLVKDDLAGSVDAVALTHTTDADASLQFRAMLGDALNATLSVSIHLNDGADIVHSPTPGTETFGALSDPSGKRAAGVIFAAERQYMDTLTPRVAGNWATDRDAGAIYRIGSRGDFYFLLRETHTTWVISESLYITNPPETKLIADPAVRSGIANAISNGIRDYIGSAQQGSGWKTPAHRSDPDSIPIPCTDPVA